MAGKSVIEYLVRFTADTKDLDAGVAQARQRLQRFGQTLDRIGAISFAAVTSGAVMATRAFASFGKSAVQVGANFENAMYILGSIRGVAASSLGDVEEEARRLGQTTLFTATEAATGMQQLARSGMEMSAIVQSAGPALEFAGANFVSMTQSTTLLAATMKQYNLSATEASMITDTFTTAAQNSLYNIEGLATSMRYGGSAGSSLGASLQETVAMLAQFRNLGLESSMAGVRFRQSMLALSAPTYKAKKALAALNIPLDEVNPRIVGLEGAFRRLGEAGLTADQLVPIVNKISAADVAKISQQIYDTAEASDTGTSNVQQLMKTMDNARGVTKKTYDQIQSSTLSQYAILQSAFQELQITVFDSLKGGPTGTEEKFSSLKDIIVGLRGVVEDVTWAFQYMLDEISGTVDSTLGPMASFLEQNSESIAASIIVNTMRAVEFAKTIASWIPILYDVAKAFTIMWGSFKIVGIAAGLTGAASGIAGLLLGGGTLATTLGTVAAFLTGPGGIVVGLGLAAVAAWNMGEAVDYAALKTERLTAAIKAKKEAESQINEGDIKRAQDDFDLEDQVQASDAIIKLLKAKGYYTDKARSKLTSMRNITQKMVEDEPTKYFQAQLEMADGKRKVFVTQSAALILSDIAKQAKKGMPKTDDYDAIPATNELAFLEELAGARERQNTAIINEGQLRKDNYQNAVMGYRRLKAEWQDFEEQAEVGPYRQLQRSTNWIKEFNLSAHEGKDTWAEWARLLGINKDAIIAIRDEQKRLHKTGSTKPDITNQIAMMQAVMVQAESGHARMKTWQDNALGRSKRWMKMETLAKADQARGIGNLTNRTNKLNKAAKKASREIENLWKKLERLKDQRIKIIVDIETNIEQLALGEEFKRLKQQLKDIGKVETAAEKEIDLAINPRLKAFRQARESMADTLNAYDALSTKQDVLRAKDAEIRTEKLANLLKGKAGPITKFVTEEEAERTKALKAAEASYHAEKAAIDAKLKLLDGYKDSTHFDPRSMQFPRVMELDPKKKEESTYIGDEVKALEEATKAKIGIYLYEGQERIAITEQNFKMIGNLWRQQDDRIKSTQKLLDDKSNQLTENERTRLHNELVDAQKQQNALAGIWQKVNEIKSDRVHYDEALRVQQSNAEKKFQKEQEDIVLTHRRRIQAKLQQHENDGLKELEAARDAAAAQTDSNLKKIFNKRLKAYVDLYEERRDLAEADDNNSLLTQTKFWEKMKLINSTFHHEVNQELLELHKKANYYDEGSIERPWREGFDAVEDMIKRDGKKWKRLYSQPVIEAGKAANKATSELLTERQKILAKGSKHIITKEERERITSLEKLKSYYSEVYNIRVELQENLESIKPLDTSSQIAELETKIANEKDAIKKKALQRELKTRKDALAREVRWYKKLKELFERQAQDAELTLKYNLKIDDDVLAEIEEGFKFDGSWIEKLLLGYARTYDKVLGSLVTDVVGKTPIFLMALFGLDPKKSQILIDREGKVVSTTFSNWWGRTWEKLVAASKDKKGFMAKLFYYDEADKDGKKFWGRAASATGQFLASIIFLDKGVKNANGQMEKFWTRVIKWTGRGIAQQKIFSKAYETTAKSLKPNLKALKAQKLEFTAIKGILRGRWIEQRLNKLYNSKETSKSVDEINRLQDELLKLKRVFGMKGGVGQGDSFHLKKTFEVIDKEGKKVTKEMPNMLNKAFMNWEYWTKGFYIGIKAVSVFALSTFWTMSKGVVKILGKINWKKVFVGIAKFAVATARAITGAINLVADGISKIKDLAASGLDFITGGLDLSLASLFQGASQAAVEDAEKAAERLKELDEKLAAGEITQEEYDEARGEGVGDADPKKAAENFMQEQIDEALAFIDYMIQAAPVVVDKLVENLPRLITAIQGAVPTIIKAFVDGIVPLVGFFMEMIATALPQLITALVQLLPGLIQNFIATIISQLPALITAIANGIVMLAQVIVQQIPTLINALFQPLEENGQSLFQMIIQGLTDAFVAIIGMLPEIIDALMAALPNIITSLIMAFTDVLAALMQAIPDILTAIMDNLPMIMEALTQGVMYLLEMLVQELPVLIIALMEMLPKMIGHIVEMAIKFVKAIIMALPDLIKALIKALPDLIKALIVFLPELVITLVFALIKAIPEIVVALVKGLIMELPWIAWELAKAIFWGIVDGVAELGRMIIRLFADVINEILTLGAAKTETFGDTPGAVKAGTSGLVAKFAGGDYVIAAQDPLNVATQAMELLGQHTKGAMTTAVARGITPLVSEPQVVEGNISSNVNISVVAEGRVLDDIQVTAMNRGRAPRMKRKLRKASGVKIGFDRGRFNKFSG